MATLSDTGLTAVRIEITHLTALFERVEGAAGANVVADAHGLEAFAAKLPPATPKQTLESLANTRRWDLADGELQQRLTTAVAAIPQQDRVPELLRALDRQPEAAYEIGHTLGELAPNDQSVERRLVAMTEDSGQNAALVGYLSTLVEHGAEGAFDQLLDSDTSSVLGDLARLRVSASGPQSDAGWARVSTLITQLSPEVGARGLFGWHNLDPSRLRGFLADWLPRIHTHRRLYAPVRMRSLPTSIRGGASR